MNIICKLLSGAALIPASLFAQEVNDSIANSWERELELNEVVVVAKRPVVKQQEGKLVYLVKNDPYAKGLDGVTVLDRIPRVSVNNGTVSVASKGETIQLTYIYFNRHSPTFSDITTAYSNSIDDYGVKENGISDYRFHSGKVDFKLPYDWAQLETGVAYTDILNSSENSIQLISTSAISNGESNYNNAEINYFGPGGLYAVLYTSFASDGIGYIRRFDESGVVSTQQNMTNYESLQLFNLSLRYSLLNNRLNLQLKANDIFGWNKTRSKEHYADYTIRQTFNANSAYVLFGISYRFGRDKVNGVYRDSKEDQSGRTK